MTVQTQDPNIDDIDDESDDDNTQPSGLRSRVKHLEKENRRLAAFEPENSELKQRIAIRDAGLELNPQQLKALTATHEGDQTPEALRATAEVLGFAQPIPDVDPADEAAHKKLADARSGASVIGNSSYDDELATATSVNEMKQIAHKHGVPWSDD